jgi:hypoxanthine-guanine phosphoribosyltransferase
MSIHKKYTLVVSTILDSGATCYVTNSYIDLTKYKEAHESEEL